MRRKSIVRFVIDDAITNLIEEKGYEVNEKGYDVPLKRNVLRQLSDGLYE